MLALRETVRIPDDHVLHVKVPNVPRGEEVEVLVLSKDDIAKKLQLMSQAARDPLYQQDIDVSGDDFMFVDQEHV